MTAVAEDVTRALQDRQNCHTAYRGYKRVSGTYTNQEAIVFLVVRKFSAGFLRSQGFEVIPSTITIGGTNLPTDVVESPAIRTLELAIGDVEAETQNEHQQCHDCPIPGGSQMAPAGAQWLGTLGCALGFDVGDGWRWGALTNWHVANGGQFGKGTKMVQPTQGGEWFGTLAGWKDIKFGGDANRIDAAVIDCRRKNGKYSPATDTVGPQLIGLGRTGQTVPEPKLGDRVSKSGRTTGVVHGTVVGVDATSRVGYGDGRTATFVEQIVVMSESGNFSGPGDSGSHVVTTDGHEPYGLLFAGGGNSTIVNPMKFVLDAFQSRMFP